MIQRNQKVVVVSGGDATRAIKVQTGSGTDDFSRFPLIYTDGVRGRDQEVQLVTGGDTTRIPKVTLDIDAYIRSLGPAAWFRPGVGITVTGSGVSQWDDQSGNGRHLLQGTDAARPALQGDGTILFNGTAHYLKTAAFTLNQPETVYLVVNQVSWTNVDTFFDGNALNSGRAFQNAGTPAFATYAGSQLSNNSNLAVGSYGVVCAVFNGASSVSLVNQTTAVTGAGGAGNMGGFTLGASGSNLNFGNIAVKECAIFPAAHDATTRARIIAGLMARHGVA